MDLSAHDRCRLSEFQARHRADGIVAADGGDVAGAALWFINGGRSITGQLLVIDGGNHLNVSGPLALRRLG